MRISHLQALVDIILGDAQALARGFHETVNGIGTDFETEDARHRFAIAVAAVGMSVDAERFRAVCSQLADAASTMRPSFEPVCKRCSSTDLSRDASAVWDPDTQQWDLCGFYDPTTSSKWVLDLVQGYYFCDACTAEGIDIVRWIATDPDAELPVIIGARVRIRDRQLVGGGSFKGHEGVVVRENSVDGYYVRLDMTPRERVQKIELITPHHLEVLWLPEPPRR